MRTPSPRFVAVSILGGLAATLLVAAVGPYIHAGYLSAFPRNLRRSIDTPRGQFGPDAINLNRFPLADDWRIEYPGDYIMSNEARPLTEDPPYWVHLADRADYTARETPYWITTTGAGWPARAFWFVRWDAQRYPQGAVFKGKGNRSYEPQIEGAWRLHRARNNLGVFDLVIPYRPIWTGLLADVAFWSCATAILLSAAARVRAVHRRRNGRCPACAYPRAGIDPAAPCPECGSVR